MSYAKSYYAEPKSAQASENNNQFSSSSGIPTTTPISEAPLTPTQIQEAIRLYRNVLSSSSAPPSPAGRQPQRQIVERPVVNSNYYGGGPTDIPQSYMINYNKPVSSPTPYEAEQYPQQKQLDEQLLAQLQNLAISQEQEQKEPVYVQKKFEGPPPSAKKMYDDEESGYCFNRKNKEQLENEDNFQQNAETPTFEYSVPQAKYIPPPPVSNNKNYSKGVSGPSEYIGMSNDCRFIYDSKNSIPASYTTQNFYSKPEVVVQRAPPPQISNEDERGMTTTEDITQLPAASPAHHQSRFRGLIQNVTSTSKATAPIVVERVSEPTEYNAFAPLNHNINMESEYQLPVLNDLASCIENY